MFHRRLIWMASAACALAGVVAAQQKKNAVPDQSPRKAIMEMLSGGENEFKKHLTLEVQEKIQELLKNSAPGSTNPMQTVAMLKAAGGDNLESFDAGPILFSYNNPQQHERLEIRIDSDDLHGEQDDMQLSVHLFQRGVEEDLPAGLRFLLSWKLQEGIWRLDAVMISARVEVGDPRIFDKPRWIPAAISPVAAKTTAQRDARAGTPDAPGGTKPPAMNENPKMTAARAVRLITLAEGIYAGKHPETGFTCFLSELIDVGRGFDNGEPYAFMDPEFGDGVYNGYKFSLSGCAGKPAKNFQVMAEPVSGSGRAYCSDNTRDLRGSDDGSGAHCLASGRIVQR